MNFGTLALWASGAVVRTGAPVHAWLFLEGWLSCCAGSAVFEGTPAPLIRPGTPRCERAPSPGSPHCAFLFLCLHSLHSVKRRGTSSISPVRNVNRRFNQTLRRPAQPPPPPPPAHRPSSPKIPPLSLARRPLFGLTARAFFASFFPRRFSFILPTLFLF